MIEIWEQQEQEIIGMREEKGAPEFCTLIVSTRSAAGCSFIRETLKQLAFIWFPEQ